MYNPFSFGDPIWGGRPFIGRQREIREIYRAIAESASVSLIGERRVGKSSLLLHLADPTVKRKNGLGTDRYAFAYFDFQGYPSLTPTELWQLLLAEIAPRLPTPELRASAQQLADAPELKFSQLERLVKAIHAARFSVAFLFDEFDTAAANTRLDEAFYGGLRSLSKYTLSYVIASRRTISELQRDQPNLTSPFFNFLRPVHLTGFTETDLDELLSKAEEAGIPFRVGDRAFVERYGGHHPFFVQAAAHYLFTAYAEKYFRDSQPDERWVLERSIEAYKLDQNFEATPPGREQLRRLRQRALIEERNGRPHLFSALFSEWIADQIALIASDRVGDFEKIVRAAKVEGPWDKWIDATERFRRGYAWVDTRAILNKVLVEKGPEVALDLLSQIIVKILFPGSPS